MVGIHHIEGSFSDKWIEYCDNNNIKYQLLDIYHSSIISQIKSADITHLLFHITTGDPRTELILKKLQIV